MTDEETIALVGAAVAWFDTEAAFGADHPRTLTAKDNLRQRVADCLQHSDAIEADLPVLTVLPGGRP